MSASGANTSGGAASHCLICGTEGLGVGIPCGFCGACGDQFTLGPQDEEQLGQVGTLTERAAFHLVRPIGK
eukprot:9206968-Alexandrium_andersonii.AAC.1